MDALLSHGPISASPPHAPRTAEAPARLASPPPCARGGVGGEALPLPDRCWGLFCQGHSYAAIGRTLGIDRETAARHVKAIHQQVQIDRRADRALALSRALATQERIQATAWTLLAHAQAQAPAQETPPSSSVSSVVKASSSSLADCARLLNIILASARETARLERLYDRDAPARQADEVPQSKTVHIIIERVGDPYVDPTQPDQPGQPDQLTAEAASGPPTTSPPSDPAGPDLSDHPNSTNDPVATAQPLSTSDPAARCGMPDRPLHAVAASARVPALQRQDRAPALRRQDTAPTDIAAPLPAHRARPRHQPARHTPLPARGERPGERPSSAGPGLRSSPRHLRFGLPVANAYPLG